MIRRKRDIKLWVFAILAAVLLVLSLTARELAPNDPYETHVLQVKQPPSSEYLFGTDSMGRCVLSRVLYGARTSIFSALLLVLITSVFGSTVGILCGYFSGKADTLVMRIIDGIMAFPQMVLAIAVAGILGGGMINAMLALGFSSWTPYARLARSRVISIKRESFIMSAKISGCSDLKIIRSYILPNVFPTLLTYASGQIGTLMLGFAGLSFLNLGVQLPEAEWGSMISEARGMLDTAPWTVFFPALAMVFTVMVFNYLGDALRDHTDVRESGVSR